MILQNKLRKKKRYDAFVIKKSRYKYIMNYKALKLCQCFGPHLPTRADGLGTRPVVAHHPVGPRRLLRGQLRACRACGSRQHCKAPHAAWVAQTLFRPSAPDLGGWVRHAPHGRSPSRRASDAATRSATCLPTVCRSAALQGPPRSLGSSNFVSALSSRP